MDTRKAQDCGSPRRASLRVSWGPPPPQVCFPGEEAELEHLHLIEGAQEFAGTPKGTRGCPTDGRCAPRGAGHREGLTSSAGSSSGGFPEEVLPGRCRQRGWATPSGRRTRLHYVDGVFQELSSQCQRSMASARAGAGTARRPRERSRQGLGLVAAVVLVFSQDPKKVLSPSRKKTRVA